MLLAIDTSTTSASLAIMDAQVMASGLSWQVGQQHSVEIFTMLGALFQGSGYGSSDLMAIAVATGPGSFNGTRVAVTVAKTLAFVWQMPIMGISTLACAAQAALLDEAVSLPLMAQGGHVLAVLEAGRDELYTCWYDLNMQTIAYPDMNLPEAEMLACETFRDAAFARPSGEIAIATVADIVASAPTGPLLLCGEASEAHLVAFQEGLGERLQVVIPPRDPNQHRAQGLGRLAQLRWAAGDFDDVLTLEPSYVRRPNITTSKRHPMKDVSSDK